MGGGLQCRRRLGELEMMIMVLVMIRIKMVVIIIRMVMTAMLSAHLFLPNGVKHVFSGPRSSFAQTEP